MFYLDAYLSHLENIPSGGAKGYVTGFFFPFFKNIKVINLFTWREGRGGITEGTKAEHKYHFPHGFKLNAVKMWRDDRMCSADWGEIELINKADGQWFCWVHLRFRLSEEWSTSPEKLYSLWRWSSGKGRGEGSRRALNWSRTKVGCGEYTQDLARRASVSGCLSGAVCQHRRLYKQKPQPKTTPTLCISPLPVSWLNWLKWEIHIITPRLVQTKSWFVFLTCSNLLVPTFFLRV